MPDFVLLVKLSLTKIGLHSLLYGESFSFLDFLLCCVTVLQLATSQLSSTFALFKMIFRWFRDLPSHKKVFEERLIESRVSRVSLRIEGPLLIAVEEKRGLL